MPKLLLDTNVLLWTVFDTKLTLGQKDLIINASEVYVSTLSVLEIRIKQELGKLPIFDILDAIDTAGIKVLSFDPKQAVTYKLHDNENKDPYDNALVSIAIAQKLTFMTSDKKILSLNVKGLHATDGKI